MKFFMMGRVKTKTIKLVFVVSPLSTQHLDKRAKTGWLRIRMSSDKVTFLSTDCCLR